MDERRNNMHDIDTCMMSTEIDISNPIEDAAENIPQPQDAQINCMLRQHALRNGRGERGSYSELLYLQYERFNREHFSGTLPKDPLITFGTPANRQAKLGHFRVTSAVGTAWEFCIDETLFANHRRCEPDDEEARAVYENGFRRLIADILLSLMVKAFCRYRLKRSDIEANGEYGTAFTKKANAIGETLGLAEVRYRQQRSLKRKDQPLACEWPFAVRPKNYYGGSHNIDGKPCWRVGLDKTRDGLLCPKSGAAKLDAGQSATERHFMALYNAVSRIPPGDSSETLLQVGLLAGYHLRKCYGAHSLPHIPKDDGQHALAIAG